MTLPSFTRTEKWLLAVHAILFVLFATPFLLHQVVPLGDFPNHLARAAIVNDPAAYDGIYIVKYQFTPYLAEYLLPLLGSIFGIYTAGKLYFLIGILSVVTGVILISRRVFGEINAATLLVYVFLLNYATLLGLINFTLAVGIALISIYLWLTYPQKTRNWFFVAGIFSFNFMMHALAGAVMAGVLATYETWPPRFKSRAWWQRSLFLGSAMLPLPLLLAFAPREAMQPGTEFGSLLEHLHAAFSEILFAHTLPDMLILPAFIALYAAGILKLAKPFRPAVLLLLCVNFLVPIQLLGIFLIQIRIPVFIFLLLAAISRFSFEKKTSQEFALIIFLLIAGYRHYEGMQKLQQCSTHYEQFITALRQTDLEGDTPVMTFGQKNYPFCSLQQSFIHANTLMTIEKKLFVPTLFTTMPPVKPTASFSHLRGGELGYRDENELLFNPSQDISDFRYILWFHPETDAPIRFDSMDVVIQEPFFTLYLNHRYRPRS